MATAKVEGAGAAVLIAFGGMIWSRLGEVSRVTGTDQMPQILRRLSKPRGHHPDETQDEEAWQNLLHMVDYSRRLIRSFGGSSRLA
jgi:hypothetical protein